MDVLEAIRPRRAIKKFDADHRLSDAEIRQLFESARLTPSAYNIQHTRYVVVTDPALRRELRAASWDQAQVTDAAILVVVCGFIGAWQDEPRRYWASAGEATQDRMAAMIHDYYVGKPEAQRDEAFRSAGMAAQTLMLAAAGMGLDSCPMDGFNFDAVGKAINLPSDHCVVMYVAIGRKAADPFPRATLVPYEEAVIENRFA